MSAGRVADCDRRTAKMFARSFDSCHNVFVRARPAAAWLAYTPILEIGRDNAPRRQCGTERVCVAEVVFRPPESAMDKNSEASHRLLGMPQFEKLACVTAIRDVFRIHSADSSSYVIPKAAYVSRVPLGGTF
jgi:hypothetical protein